MPGEVESEFDKFFDSVNDPQFLFEFFETNKDDLRSGFWGKLTSEDAAQLTIEDANVMEDALYEYAEKGFFQSSKSLEQLLCRLTITNM